MVSIILIKLKLKDKFIENTIFTISFSDPLENHWKFGKIINAKVYIDTFNENNFNILIGTLNSINRFIYSIELLFSFSKKIKKITIGNKEFYKNEIKNFSLKSIGINENFFCKVQLEI